MNPTEFRKHIDRLVAQFYMVDATPFYAAADAWETDRLAGHEWRIEGESLRKRLTAVELPSALCDLCYEDECGGPSVCNCPCHSSESET